MSDNFQEKQQIILDYEHRLASRLAKKVVEKPTLTVWRIIMPLLLIYHAIKLKEYRKEIEIFTRGVLKSKILALGSAINEIRLNSPDQGYVHSLSDATDSSTPNRKLFISRQKAEVELLKSHYKKILKSSGRDYAELVKNVYGKPGAYREYLLKLDKAEQDVRDSVLKLHHPGDSAREMSRKMMQAVRSIRKDQVREIFSQD